MSKPFTMKFKKYILSLTLLAAFFCVAPAQTRVNGKFIDAVQNYSAGHYQSAISLLDKVIDEDPGNDAAWYYKGLSQMSLEDQDGGEKSMVKAVGLDSSNYWYRYNLAMIYNYSKKDSLAITEFEKLAELFPKKSDTYYSLVNLYIAAGKLDKAVETIGSIEEINGKSDATVMTKYRIFLQQQKPEEALETLKEYNSEYSSPQVLSMLGDHEIGMSNDSLAIGYYNEALSLDSSYSPAILGKVEVYRMTRKYPEYFSALRDMAAGDAVPVESKADYMDQLTRHLDPRFLKTYEAQLDTTYQIMLDHHPSDTALKQVAGIYYFNTGRAEKSKAVFKSYMEQNPRDFRATLYYLQILSETKDYETMVQACEDAARRFPESGGFDDMVIGAEYNLGHYQKVIDRCGIMLQKAPADSAVCLNVFSTTGDMYHLLGEKQKAYKCYDKALKINPDYVPVLNNYAYYLSLEGKSLGKAYKMSKKTIEAEPDNATYLDTFAWILHLQGKDLEAKPFFKHAMLYGGKDSATILEHYATVLEKLGEIDLANVYKTQAKSKEATENE